MIGESLYKTPGRVPSLTISFESSETTSDLMSRCYSMLSCSTQWSTFVPKLFASHIITIIINDPFLQDELRWSTTFIQCNNNSRMRNETSVSSETRIGEVKNYSPRISMASEFFITLWLYPLMISELWNF